MDTQNLLKDIEAFCEATGTAPSTFGQQAINDGKFIPQLKGGRRVWPETEQKVRAFIENHNKQKTTKQDINQ